MGRGLGRQSIVEGRHIHDVVLRQAFCRMTSTSFLSTYVLFSWPFRRRSWHVFGVAFEGTQLSGTHNFVFVIEITPESLLDHSVRSPTINSVLYPAVRFCPLGDGIHSRRDKFS